MCIVRAGKVFGRSAKMVKAYHFIVQRCIVSALSGVGPGTQVLEHHMMYFVYIKGVHARPCREAEDFRGKIKDKA
jgi:hypothetical protein